MARIKEYRDIAVTDLTIGKGQARTKDVGQGIEDLAASIRKIGLLEPIVVCEADAPGKYEVLTGQRRFLAIASLGLSSISAAVLDSKVSEMEAKVISVTENLVRRDLSSKDLIDACTYLFKKYGSIKTVSEETGLPYSDVSKYVKYDRLPGDLKKMVDGGVPLATALRAQNAAAQMGGSGTEVAQAAVKLAKEMGGMTNAQQRKLVKGVESATPGKAIEDVIEEAKSGAKITQIVVTVGTDLQDRLQHFAKDEGTTQDDAAVTLLDEGLTAKGYGS